MSHKPFAPERPPGHRPARYAQRLREELSELIPGDLRDPRLAEVGFVTITAVEVTPDLRNATVRFALMGDERRSDDVQAALNQAAGYLRRQLMRRIETKNTPQLAFEYDRGLDTAQQIDSLLKSVR